MKKVILTVLAFGLASCASQQAVQTTNTNQPPRAANASAGKSSSDLPVVSSSHSAQQQSSPAAALASNSALTNSAPSANENGGRSPMERSIDTSEMDAAIEKAAKDFKLKPTNAGAKTALAEAYFARATALTEAAQYRAALGDYRRGLKLDPTNAEAKEMQDQIISIFQSLNREPPKEGTEPPALPFKKV